MYDIEKNVLPVPLGARGAALAASCRAALTALVPAASNGGAATFDARTWSVGFDADRDGVPDPCPPEPVPTPTAAPPASPTPSAGPGARRPLIPIQRGPLLPRTLER